jgi:hypothetical protein
MLAFLAASLQSKLALGWQPDIAMTEPDLRIAVLTSGALTCIGSFIVWRLHRLPAFLVGILASLAGIVGVLPAIIAPNVSWIRMPASLLSMSLSLAAFIVLIRIYGQRASSLRGKLPSIIFILGLLLDLVGVVMIVGLFHSTLLGITLLVAGTGVQEMAFVVSRRTSSRVAAHSESSG